MPKTEDNEDVYLQNTAPICPYCDYPHGLEDEWEVYNDGDHRLICQDCEKEYDVLTYVEHRFSTGKLGEFI